MIRIKNEIKLRGIKECLVLVFKCLTYFLGKYCPCSGWLGLMMKDRRDEIGQTLNNKPWNRAQTVTCFRIS